MKALSLWQPHAQAIALGLKPYETRHWSTNYRGPLAIHAAKKPLKASDYPCRWYSEMQARLYGQGCSEHELAYGAIVCVVDLVGCFSTSELRGKISRDHEFWGDFSDGRFAFSLKNLRVLDQPRPYAGRQGLFELPFEVRA